MLLVSRFIAVTVLAFAACMASHAVGIRSTPLPLQMSHTTIANLHQLQSLGVAHADWSTRLDLIGKQHSSVTSPLRSALQSYEPLAFTPRFDRLNVTRRLQEDLLTFQRERGLPTTGIFDAATKFRLDRYMHDSIGLTHAKAAAVRGTRFAILRRSDRAGSLWHLTLGEGREVYLNSLNDLHGEVASTEGGRPVVFAPDASEADLVKLRSSLRITANQGDHPVPMLVQGEPDPNLKYIEVDAIDYGRTAGALSRAATLTHDGFFYRQAPVMTVAGSKFTLRLWARSQAMLLRMVTAFVEFAAGKALEYQSTAEFGHALRDFLFDRGIAANDAFIEIVADESGSRQWAELAQPWQESLACR